MPKKGGKGKGETKEAPKKGEAKKGKGEKKEEK